jgi:hypothetical protein
MGPSSESFTQNKVACHSEAVVAGLGKSHEADVQRLQDIRDAGINLHRRLISPHWVVRVEC